MAGGRLALLLCLCALAACVPLNSSAAELAQADYASLCARASPLLVIYNRVPKAASSSMLALLARLQTDGEVSWVHSTEYSHREWWNEDDEVLAAKKIMRQTLQARALIQENKQQERAVVYDQHMRYVDFGPAINTPESLSLFGQQPTRSPSHVPLVAPVPQLAYINVVREPVDRAVSSYYYALSNNRHQSKIREALKRRGPESNLTVDECLALPEATRRCGFKGEGNLMTAFFCGHRGPCRCVGVGAIKCSAEDRMRALQLAMAHMDQYALVGLQSEMEDTLKLLSGLLEPFETIADFKVPRERRTRYSPPSAAARQALAAMLDLDVQLYDHAVALFERRRAACLSH